MIEPETPLLTDAELADLPVFPLPAAVLFPGTSIGLHLFEPRYRALMRHCLEKGPRAMAIAQLRPGFEEDYEGRPPLHEIAGAGRIVSHRGNPDGTFDLILEGTQRVRLSELPFVPPFRRARAETIPSRITRPELVARMAEQARSQAASLARASRVPVPPPELRGSPERVADLMLDLLVRDPVERQRLLETVDVYERYLAIAERMSELGVDRARGSKAN